MWVYFDGKEGHKATEHMLFSFFPSNDLGHYCVQGARPAFTTPKSIQIQCKLAEFMNSLVYCDVW